MKQQYAVEKRKKKEHLKRKRLTSLIGVSNVFYVHLKKDKEEIPEL